MTEPICGYLCLSVSICGYLRLSASICGYLCPSAAEATECRASQTRRLCRVARDFPHELGNVVFTSKARDVGLRDDAGATSAFIDDQNSPNLMFLHLRHDILQRRGGLSRDDRFRHALSSCVRHRILAVRDRAADDIAIGYDSNRAIRSIDYGNFATVVLHHQLRHLVERHLWRAARGVRRHHIASNFCHVWVAPGRRELKSRSHATEMPVGV